MDQTQCPEVSCGSQFGDVPTETWCVSNQSFLRGSFSVGSEATLGLLGPL